MMKTKLSERGQDLITFGIIVFVVFMVGFAVWALLYPVISSQGQAYHDQATTSISHEIDVSTRGDAHPQPDAKRIEALVAAAEGGTAWKNETSSVSYLKYGDCGLQMTVQVGGVLDGVGTNKYFTRTWMCGVTTESEIVNDFQSLDKEIEDSGFEEEYTDPVRSFLRGLQIEILRAILGI